jgi:2-keto-4-pentenoate hydratase/2-oxohepta-3-ene-1,7-dioic acid hydratase in catechol pathway
MKLLRWGERDRERPGMLDADGRARDLTGIVPDIAGAVLAPEGLAALRALDPSSLPPVPEGARLGPCVGGTRSFVCIGLNFADHARETGATPPAEPIIFLKATSAIAGPHDDLELPRGGDKTDWEVELGVVIGSRTKYVAEADAMAHVAGYCVVNDLSERRFQLEGTGTWDKGKGCDGFGPIGPWLVTADEIPDPHDLAMRLDVNGRTRQNGSTRTMIFGVPHLVSYVSRFIRLEPGDIISTGTPPGVGLGQTPPTYLRPGDRVELEIAGLGRQRQRVIAPA